MIFVQRGAAPPKIQFSQQDEGDAARNEYCIDGDNKRYAQSVNVKFSGIIILFIKATHSKSWYTSLQSSGSSTGLPNRRTTRNG